MLGSSTSMTLARPRPNASTSSPTTASACGSAARVRGHFGECLLRTGASRVLALGAAPTRVKLEAAHLAARARRAFGEGVPSHGFGSERALAPPRTDGVMPPFAAEALRAVPDAPAHHDSSADAGSHDDAEHDAAEVLPARPEARFGDGEAVRVVLEAHARSERGREVFAKRSPVQARRVRVLHDAGHAASPSPACRRRRESNGKSTRACCATLCTSSAVRASTAS